MPDRDYDFVIAGGGSAASAAAMRLVRDLGFSVLMLERGPRDTARLMKMPAGYMKYLARDVAFGKLKAMADGAAIVRQEL